MTSVLLFAAAGLAALFGLWPLTIAGVVLGVLAYGGDAAQKRSDEEGGSALAMLLLWILLGLVGLAVLGLAVAAVRP